MTSLRKFIRKILRIEMKKFDEFNKDNTNDSKHVKSYESFNEQKIEDNYVIDYSTYLVVDDENKSSQIAIKIEKIIVKYGKGQTYIGKTCNPHGRMTGDYSLTESSDSSSEKPEDYDFAPHDKPHIENDYGKMFILFQSDDIKKILDFEKIYIDSFKDRIRNGAAGGAGRHGDAPYYLYVVVQKEIL